MSKITNGGLKRSGTQWFMAVPIWQQWWTSNGQWHISTITLFSAIHVGSCCKNMAQKTN